MKLSVEFSETDAAFATEMAENDQAFSTNMGEITVLHAGQNGATFIPYVSPNGIISWTNDRDFPNPEPVNIKGKDGYTPQKNVDYFDGKNGKDGTDGYTPQRGTDYWTETDKAEIKSYVDQAILGGEW